MAPDREDSVQDTAEALLAEREARLRASEALLDIVRATNATLDLKQVLQILARRTAQAIGAARCSISLWRDGHLVPVMSQFADGHSDPALWKRFQALGPHPLGNLPVNTTAIRTKSPVIVEDTLESSLIARYWYDAYGVRAFLLVPLIRQDEVVGTLSVDQTDGPYKWDQAQIDLAMTIANHAALVVDNARLYGDGQLRLARATALAEMATVLSSTIELQPLLKEIAQRTAHAVGVDRCSVFLSRADGTLQAVMSQFADGHTDPDFWRRFKAVSQRPVEDIKALSEAIRLAQPVLIEDAATSEMVPGWWTEAFSLKNLVVVPLIRKDVVIGVLHLSNTVAGRPLTEDQVALARTIASQVALAIDNAQLYEQVRAQLSELQKAQAQLLQAGKLAAVGQLVAGVAHELNNPLAVVVGQAQLLKLKRADPVVIDKADRILGSALRAAGIVRQLQTVARPESSHREAVRLADVLDCVLALRGDTLRAAGIVVECDIAPGLPAIWGDARQLEQVVLNLLLNAEQAMRDESRESRVLFRLGVHAGRVRMVVSDNGVGIDSDVLPRIFEPFFTTKPVGQGTGLGLSLCFSIVSSHGGHLWAESEVGQGASFILELPAHSAPRAAEPSPASLSPRQGQVLVIDDEQEVADALRELLESLGQSVTVAIGGERGWALLQGPEADYDVVTLDLKMPDLSGPKAWDRLVAAASPLADRVVFVTGDTVDPETQEFLGRVGRPVLTKPVTLADLATILPGA